MESRSAEAIFTDLETLGYDALEMIRKEAFTPNINKSLRTWGISDASLMIKRSGTHIRNYLKKNNKYPDSSGIKKLLKFSLSEINEIRANFKTSPPHSDNPAIIAFANLERMLAIRHWTILIHRNLLLWRLSTFKSTERTYSGFPSEWGFLHSAYCGLDGCRFLNGHGPWYSSMGTSQHGRFFTLSGQAASGRTLAGAPFTATSIQMSCIKTGLQSCLS